MTLDIYRVVRQTLWILMLSLAGFALSAEARFHERATCYQTTEPIEIDGRLDEASWVFTAPLGPFRENESGDAARDSTIARLLWDDANLYVAFECADGDIQAEKTIGDNWTYKDDMVHVGIYLEAEGKGRYIVADRKLPLISSMS